MWCSAQALLLLCLRLAPRKVSWTSLSTEGMGGGGAFTADVRFCAGEPEGMTGEYWRALQQLVEMLHINTKTQKPVQLNEV